MPRMMQRPTSHRALPRVASRVLDGLRVTAAGACVVVGFALHAAAQTAAPSPPAATPPPVPPQASVECRSPDSGTPGDIALPAVANALREKRQLKILTIGASGSAGADPQSGGYQAVFESRLEAMLKGVDVVIVDRGVSGELARDAGERIKAEVALDAPALVLWQVGTRDAMARIPVEDFEAALGETVRWLKEHNVDVVLVGLHFARTLVADQSYQEIRAAVQRVARAEKVLRVARYELTEWLEQAKANGGGAPADEFQLTEAGYGCLAENAARAIAATVFAKPTRGKPAG